MFVYSKEFLKQLSVIPKNYRVKIEFFVFNELTHINSFQELGNIEKMQGYDGFYKIRFGMYRLGLKVENKNIIVKTITHRKEIYKFFP